MVAETGLQLHSCMYIVYNDCIIHIYIYLRIYIYVYSRIDYVDTFHAHKTVNAHGQPGVGRNQVLGFEGGGQSSKNLRKWTKG